MLSLGELVELGGKLGRVVFGIGEGEGDPSTWHGQADSNCVGQGMLLGAGGWSWKVVVT